MAFKSLFFHLITAMVAVNLICADEESERALPFFDFFGGGGNSSSGLPNLPNFSDLPFFGSFGSQLPSFFGAREKRSADNHEDEHRFLFGGNRVPCNFTTQGGVSCTSCNQTLVCLPNNVGRLITCRGLFRNCNNGWCSLLPSDECRSDSNSTAAN